jgi:hypothetical protein
LEPEQQPSPLGQQAAPGQAGEAPPNLFPLLPIALSFLSALQQGPAAGVQPRGEQPQGPASSSNGDDAIAASGSSSLGGSFSSLLSIAADVVVTRSVPFSPNP